MLRATSDLFSVGLSGGKCWSGVVWVPFSRQINAVFESERSLLLKLVAGAFVGFCVGASLARGWAANHLEKTPVLVYFAIVAGAIVLAVGLVFVLHLKDAVRRRMARAQPVHRVLRLLLASGWLSLLLWVVATLAVSLFMAIALA